MATSHSQQQLQQQPLQPQPSFFSSATSGWAFDWEKLFCVAPYLPCVEYKQPQPQQQQQTPPPITKYRCECLGWKNPRLLSSSSSSSSSPTSTSNEDLPCAQCGHVLTSHGALLSLTNHPYAREELDKKLAIVTEIEQLLHELTNSDEPRVTADNPAKIHKLKA
jgi:hypothetical protein